MFYNVSVVFWFYSTLITAFSGNSPGTFGGGVGNLTQLKSEIVLDNSDLVAHSSSRATQYLLKCCLKLKADTDSVLLGGFQCSHSAFIESND